MPKPDVLLEETYRLAGSDVRLSVTIGEGQAGLSTVKLGTKKLVVAGGAIGDLLVGPGPELDGARLVVQSVVTDVSTMTNRMSVTCALEGGRARKVFRAEGKAAAAGDTLHFRVVFALVAGGR